MRNRLIALLVLFTVVIFSSAQAQTTARKFEAGKNTFLLDGEPFVVKAAELHYTRIPQAYWEHRIEMCKALGMNTICIYIFWNIHEQEEGKFDFSGQNDIAAFCRAAQKHGMYVIVRPLCVCGMGNGRSSLVAAEEKRCGASYARSLLYGARRHLYERSRQTIGATANK